MGPKPKPEEVQMVLDALSEEEIKQLHKDNPFRVERNNKIKELCRRGVKMYIIAEITGLSETTVLRAIRNETKFQTRALNLDGENVAE